MFSCFSVTAALSFVSRKPVLEVQHKPDCAATKDLKFLIYRKILNFGTLENFDVILLKLEKRGFSVFSSTARSAKELL